jgi:thiamine-phosphate pyrophosphorylase
VRSRALGAVIDDSPPHGQRGAAGRAALGAGVGLDDLRAPAAHRQELALSRARPGRRRPPAPAPRGVSQTKSDDHDRGQTEHNFHGKTASLAETASDRYHESRSGNPIRLRDFGSMPTDYEDRRDRLARARLYLVCDRRPANFLRAALAGGVDLVQLRDKTATDDDLRAAAETFRSCCDEAGALFLLNDRPDLAVASGADGVHLGQDDMEPARAREIVGDALIVGRSTHSAAQIDAATGVEYIAVGPVHATPTKPGRPAVGLEPVRHAAAHARVPWFAIGGLDAANVGETIAAGARRVVVVRAITESADPQAAARALRGALDAAPKEVGVGPA